MIHLLSFISIFIAAAIATIITNFLARDKGSRAIISVWLTIFIVSCIIAGLIITIISL